MNGSDEEKEQTYLLDDVEVRKTGRVATKKLRRNNKIDERFEVTPVDKMQGVWLKWVRDTDLYEIE
jgi:hypothetical protein